MADDEAKNSPDDESTEAGDPEALPAPGAGDLAESGDDSTAPTTLGAAKYVHAAFFVVGVGVAFLLGRVLAGVWDLLAAWPAAVRAVPQLLLYGEDERPDFTIVVGVLFGVLCVVQMFRRQELRQWADDVAGELSKVVWPTRETVTNGTIVVIVASAIAAAYVGLLDRLWGFVTTLVYGA